ncbi:Gfo/Idh/MocA family protein [Bailinhaonella thermotolerans]|uniref:Gfo/Idh/MocA family oxidoreductase n=1 Tax=Bailinhaonella thermotolerans TaxID=1070861 RepID=A0A3A4B3E8_9ACTN|nr:Gfo/Idh/MocA family oxidoreductase [Bailinhaonella thermotolerans]RJL31920.1 gfo/Idh/MocA family oxidoreductase [Bailinhaonella thermotolerans]
MRIGFAGLATSHPFSDARTLARHGELVVWEEDAERLARFTAEHPGAVVAPTLGGLIDARPDGVVLTVPTPRVAAALAPVLDAGVPVFVNKPAAATREQLTALDALVAPAAHRVLSTSVLRFAPAFAGRAVDPAEVLAVRATVRHDVGLWATGYNPWQDTPGEGGGTMVTMGIHGVELLVALLGPGVRLSGAAGSVRRHAGLRSEDTGVMALRWDGGITGTVEILGVTAEESYTVAVHTREATETIVIEAGADPLKGLGYEGTVEAFLAMVGGAPSPVPWEQTRAILDVLVTAREAVPTA